MFDDVLFNRRPPYAILGGVKEALQATNGQVYGISNDDAAGAKRLFEESEEIDILNAPGIAVAALGEAVRSGEVKSQDIILLNITGGGESWIKEDHDPIALLPDATVSRWEEAISFLEQTT